MFRLGVFLKNVRRDFDSSLKSFLVAEGINIANLKVLIFSIVRDSLLALCTLFSVIWITHFLISNLGNTYKFLFALTFLIPAFVEWRKRRTFLDIFLVMLKFSLVPFFLVMLFEFEGVWDAQSTYKELSIENFFKDMTFSKSFFGASFGVSLYFDRILENSSRHIRGQHSDFKKTLMILRDGLILFIGLHFGLSFFILGIVCLAIKDSYFWINLKLFQKELVSNSATKKS